MVKGMIYLGFGKIYKLIYAVIVWAAALIIVKPKRILKLWSISLLAALALFETELFFTSLKQYKFNNPFLPIVGIPLFHLIWGAGNRR